MAGFWYWCWRRKAANRGVADSYNDSYNAIITNGRDNEPTTNYWLTQTIADFFAGSRFFNSRAAVPSEISAGCGKSENGRAPWAMETPAVPSTLCSEAIGA